MNKPDQAMKDLCGWKKVSPERISPNSTRLLEAHLLHKSNCSPFSPDKLALELFSTDRVFSDAQLARTWETPDGIVLSSCREPNSKPGGSPVCVSIDSKIADS